MSCLLCPVCIFSNPYIVHAAEEQTLLPFPFPLILPPHSPQPICPWTPCVLLLFPSLNPNPTPRVSLYIFSLSFFFFYLIHGVFTTFFARERRKFFIYLLHSLRWWSGCKFSLLVSLFGKSCAVAATPGCVRVCVCV